MHSGNGKHQFQRGKPKHHYRRPERYYSPDIDYRVGKISGKSKFYGKYGARSAQQYGGCVCNIIRGKRDNARQRSRNKIIQKKFPAAHAPFYLNTKDKKPQHIKDNVGPSAGIVDKHVGNKLPKPASEHQRRKHCQINGNISEKMLGKVNQDIDSYQIVNNLPVTVPKRSADYLHNHKLTLKLPLLQADTILMKRFWLVLVFIAVPLYAQEVLRGQVKIELEQIRGFSTENIRPLSPAEAKQTGLEDAARYFGAMIYGWSFRYDVGEKARKIEETLELTPMGTVNNDDPRIILTDIQMNGPVMYLWVDYRPEQTQLYRLEKWKAGSVRTAQGYGDSPLENKYAALEDAARATIRSILRGNERNRPKEVTGFISLAAFPMYWLNKGHWTAFGRFNVDIREVTPFAAY